MADNVVVTDRGAPNVNITQVSIGTTAGGTTLLAARNGRRSVTFINLDGSTSVYLDDSDATVTSTSGITLRAGESIRIESQYGFKALSASGTVLVGVVEEY